MDTLIAEPMFPDDETPEHAHERLLRDWQDMLTDDEYSEDEYDEMYRKGEIDER